MILQTQGKMLTLLMALECQKNEKRFLESVTDALTLAREIKLNPTKQKIISNDRT